MYLEHLAVAEGKEVLKMHTQNHTEGGISKFHRNQLKEFLMKKNGQFEQQNKVVLGYNPTYKINIHRITLI